MVKAWKKSSSSNFQKLADELNSTFDLQSTEMESLPGKYWLTSIGINLLSQEFDTAFLIVMKCDNYCGYIAADASKLLDNSKRHMVCLLYQNNHYEYMEINQRYYNDCMELLWKIFAKINCAIVEERYNGLLGRLMYFN